MHILNRLLLWINIISYLLIFWRLFHYQRNGARFRLCISFFAYVIMLATLSIPIMIMTGYITQTSIPHSLMALTLLVAIWSSRGNLSRLLSSSHK